MKHYRILSLAIVLALGLAACMKQETAGPAPDGERDAGAQSVPAGEAQQAGSGEVDDAEPPATADTAGTSTDGFDITRLPVSNAPLGDFPYIGLPRGYSAAGRSSFDKDFARFPFWVKGEPVWVEGRFYGADFSPMGDKSMSEYEVKKNFDGLVAQLGGIKVSEEKIPSAVVDGWGQEITQGFNGGLGDVWSSPTTTYLIRRADGNVWVHLVTNTAQGWYIVGREEGFEQSAELLPLQASDLKSQIDASGKVAVPVNFATDSTRILPDSMPQIEQVAKLLADDPSLRLAINGHTDNTGEASRNKTLSEGRARSVVAALVTRGIDAARLNAAGFGDSEPVADNGSEEGRAKNRRVELVKR